MGFVREYLLGLFGLLATLASGFVPRWVKRLAEYLINVPFLGAFLGLLARPARTPPPARPPPLHNPVNVTIRTEDQERWAAAVLIGTRPLCRAIDNQTALLIEQNELLRRLVELQEQRPDYTYELVGRHMILNATTL